jgi:hypothetical protein
MVPYAGGIFRGIPPLARSRAPQQLPKKEFALFERSEFANSRQMRGAQGTRRRRASDTGRPFFWFFSLGVQRKERNIRKKAVVGLRCANHDLQLTNLCKSIYLTQRRKGAK